MTDTEEMNKKRTKSIRRPKGKGEEKKAKKRRKKKDLSKPENACLVGEKKTRKWGRRENWKYTS